MSAFCREEAVKLRKTRTDGRVSHLDIPFRRILRVDVKLDAEVKRARWKAVRAGSLGESIQHPVLSYIQHPSFSSVTASIQVTIYISTINILSDLCIVFTIDIWKHGPFSI
jgi:hypothetical protein